MCSYFEGHIRVVLFKWAFVIHMTWRHPSGFWRARCALPGVYSRTVAWSAWRAWNLLQKQPKRGSQPWPSKCSEKWSNSTEARTNCQRFIGRIAGADRPGGGARNFYCAYSMARFARGSWPDRRQQRRRGCIMAVLRIRAGQNIDSVLNMSMRLVV